MTLSNELQQHGVPDQPFKRKGPVWRGPEEDGITFSLLSRFLACRERFRLYVVEGLAPPDGFNHRIEYGNMWHLCEERYAMDSAAKVCVPSSKALPWESDLKSYAQQLCRRYPTQQEQVQHWYNVCRIQFPVYVDYWSKHKDTLQRKPLLQEQTFNVPYKLPSGRVVKLRGKWDSVDLVNGGIVLQENKTVADIDELRIARQLRFDLQTMLYLVALREPVPGSIHAKTAAQIAGVRYNVVRRPLSGGKHTIVQHKPSKSNPLGENKEQYYSRLQGLIREDAGYFFMRWNVEISANDIAVFRRTCLDPILEQLCDWWKFVSEGDPWSRPETPNDCFKEYGIHFRFPFGVYNPTLEGNAANLDAYLETGSTVGLRRVENLFPELSE